MKPLTINLQINVYPDGTVAVSGSPSATPPFAPAAPALTTGALNSSNSVPVSPPTSSAQDSTASSPAAAGSPASAADGPSESDVRTALLAAVKATTKASAVGVLESIAGVTRVPDVPAELRAAVITQLNVLAATAAAAE